MIATRQKVAKTHRIDAVADRAFYPRASVNGAPLAVVACHFNFAGFKRNVSNLLRFLREMDMAEIPVFGVEAIAPGTAGTMTRNSRWRTVGVNRRGLMFQKEALLNAAVRMVPEDIPYIAVVDADVRFDSTDWRDRAVAQLAQTPAIQPFHGCIWTDEAGRVERSRRAAAAAGLDSTWIGHPGFAWAFERSFFDEVGLYPWAVTGSGDTALTVGLMDLEIETFQICRNAVGRLNFKLFRAWKDRAQEWLAGRVVGFIEGDVWHEWHGTWDDRQYAPRHELMAKIDVQKDCRMTEAGWIEWTDAAPPQVSVAMANYFRSRKEDGK
jgi:hypothetical protein